jgi:hypothetical protein
MRVAPIVFAPSLILASLAAGLSGGPARAAENLASASFEGDEVGAVAAPNGPPTVLEAIYDRSSGSGGVSAVVSWTGGKRYRIGDRNEPGLSRGIRAPLSSTVSSGTLVVKAVITAEQTDGGGTLGVSGPDEDGWVSRTGFAANGMFAVHGSPTGTSYAVDHRYLVTMTLNLSAGTVDYLVEDLNTSQLILHSTGHPIPVGAAAANVVFATGVDEEGAFTFDDLLATH